MKNIFKFSAFYLLLLIIYPIFVNAYSYTGEKWSSYPVSIDVTDLSFPSEWISSLANSMTTWNNTSSPFYFNSGSSGHKIITVNRGINGVPAFASCNTGSAYTGETKKRTLDTDDINGINAIYP